jgi:hypothetical protein
MNGMITAASKIAGQIGGDSTNLYRSACSIDRFSQQIYSQQAIYMPYNPSYERYMADLRTEAGI